MYKSLKKGNCLNKIIEEILPRNPNAWCYSGLDPQIETATTSIVDRNSQTKSVASEPYH